MTRQESGVLTLLEKAKKETMESSHAAGASGQWDRAERMLQWAREIDGIIAGMRQNGSGPASLRQSPGASRASNRDKLPHYYLDGGRLVKVGASRDGKTYQHRVTREHFDRVIAQLAVLAREGKAFETPDLVRRCDVPRHEPLIVLAVLEEMKLVINVRRGRWVFANAQDFTADAERYWNAIARRS